jgi:hypothetical protein
MNTLRRASLSDKADHVSMREVLEVRFLKLGSILLLVAAALGASKAQSPTESVSPLPSASVPAGPQPTASIAPLQASPQPTARVTPLPSASPGGSQPQTNNTVTPTPTPRP